MRGTRKRSVYFPPDMLAEIEHEMTRQERTLSWLMQQAWRVARPTLSSVPGVEEQLAGGRD
jgi:uncharacterized small protein (TIGR04563 family)